MRQRFGLPARALRPADYFVVVDAGERLAALHVDAPGWLTEVPAGALTQTRRLTQHARHVAGTVRLEEGIVAIHDVATFLSRAEADALDAALGARPGEAGRDALPGGGAADRRDA
jgi:chemotaxis signal transduction protein